MMRKRIMGAIGFAALLGMIQTSEGAAILYTSRATWEAAVGPLSGTEDFNSFAVDTEFRTSSVALNNMTLTGETGNNGSTANKIDVPEFEKPKVYTPLDVDGTNFIFGDLASSQEMEFDMTVDVTAWGVDTAGIANDATMTTQMLIYDDSDTLLETYVFPTSNVADGIGFIGIRTTGGDVVGRIVFTNTSPFFDYFGLDNIGFATSSVEAPGLPEPSSLVLLGLGTVGLLTLVRRRTPNEIG
ncbi:MAG: PEP-CTERM sorting domain-containing protein [Planctomycetaceae bacterium]